MIIWPRELVREIARRRCVLFFGAGISMNSVGKDGKTRPPGWGEFLLHAIDQIPNISRKLRKDIKSLIDRTDYLTAAEVIRTELKPDGFKALVKEAFHSPDFQPATIHSHLYKLDLRIAITPNFDGIYEAAAGQRGAGAITVKNYYEDDIAEALRRNETVLIKSHGSVSSANKLIFTRSDYAKARNQHGQFYELIDALLRTHTFIFVGCGMDDPDIRSLLENYCYRHPSAQNHYFITASNNYNKEIKKVLSESLKINILEYAYTKDHSNLTKSLEQLIKTLELERKEVGERQLW
ncbi:SIR2 family protein [Herbaspirillum robiniae]|uniref:SIR2 family protein n=1 Tax=Herbaspirillum robiniae TaxID=2014887 RepID=A0A246WWG0_9BURK|nr:SIR2 family protein [Herbaspirillum robiniae]OWY31363.1 SIR2 family protein [Herbaspirillum robiniae]